MFFWTWSDIVTSSGFMVYSNYHDFTFLSKVETSPTRSSKLHLWEVVVPRRWDLVYYVTEILTCVFWAKWVMNGKRFKPACKYYTTYFMKVNYPIQPTRSSQSKYGLDTDAGDEEHRTASCSTNALVEAGKDRP